MNDNEKLARTALNEGNLVGAAEYCRAWRLEEPSCSEAFNLSGVIALRCGDCALALSFLQNATVLNPYDAKAWCNLGVTSKEVELRSEAVSCFRKALSLESHNEKIIYNLALALVEQGNYFEAREVLEAWPTNTAQTIEVGWLEAQVLHSLGEVDKSLEVVARLVNVFPSHIQLWRLLGNLLRKTGNDEEAVSAYRKALVLSPDDLESLRGVGNLLVSLAQPSEGRMFLMRAVELGADIPSIHIEYAQSLVANGAFIDARRELEKALIRWPENAELHFNLGLVYGEYFDKTLAQQEVRKSLTLDPSLHLAQNYLGVLFEKSGLPDEASACYRVAISLSTEFAESYCNLGNVLAGQMKLDQAEESYRKAILLKQEFPEAHHNLGLVLLLTGRFDEGWREYEWRWKTPDVRPHFRRFAQPEWRGEAIAGKRVFVHAEQGYGDTIQFVRYMPKLKQQGAQVIFECPPSLVSLFTGLYGVDVLLRRGDPIPEFDYHVPLLNIPGLMNTRQETIPANIPYLHSRMGGGTDGKDWCERLSALSAGYRVGIAWAGNPKHANDHFRSIPASELAGLADLENIHWISLQKTGHGDSSGKRHFPARLIDWTSELNDYADTASLIDKLDLVIAVDTSVAHLAGALGKPVWILLPFVPDWRWLLDRQTTAWYPTAKLYRQQQAGTWGSVLDKVKADLKAIKKAPLQGASIDGNRKL